MSNIDMMEQYMNREREEQFLTQESAAYDVVLEAPDEKGKAPRAEAGRRVYTPRSRPPRRSIRRLLVGALSLFGIVAQHEGKESYGQGQTTVEIASRNPNSEMVVESEGRVDIETVEWRKQRYSAKEFNEILLVSFQEALGHLADRCDDAEQCYYYYADQLQSDAEPIVALTEKSRDELEWIGDVIRTGFAWQSGFSMQGAFVGVAEAGREHLPPMKKEEKRDFYRMLYEYHRTTVADAYAEFRIPERTTQEQEEFKGLVAKNIETATVLAAVDMQVQYGLKQYGGEFQKWFFEGVGDGVPSGNDKWEKAFRGHEQAIQNLYDYAMTHLLPEDAGDSVEAQRAFALARSAEEYYSDRLDLSVEAHAQASGRLFGGGEVRAWSRMATEERARLDTLKKKITAVKKEQTALAAIAVQRGE